LRIDNLLAAIDSSLSVSSEGNGLEIDYPAPLRLTLQGYPDWIGMTGQNGSQQVAILLRNRWPLWIGISGHIASEYALEFNEQKDEGLLSYTYIPIQNELMKERKKKANKLKDSL
jgi:hypothetical protein